MYVINFTEYDKPVGPFVYRDDAHRFVEDNVAIVEDHIPYTVTSKVPDVTKTTDPEGFLQIARERRNEPKGSL